MTDKTIEPRHQYGRTSYSVYAFDTYPRGSVLEGQTRKRFVASYDSEADAVAAFPGASVGYRSAGNTYGHLPSEADPVPGGMYPDDYCGC